MISLSGMEVEKFSAAFDRLIFFAFMLTQDGVIRIFPRLLGSWDTLEHHVNILGPNQIPTT